MDPQLFVLSIVSKTRESPFTSSSYPPKHLSAFRTRMSILCALPLPTIAVLLVFPEDFHYGEITRLQERSFSELRASDGQAWQFAAQRFVPNSAPLDFLLEMSYILTESVHAAPKPVKRLPRGLSSEPSPFQRLATVSNDPLVPRTSTHLY